MLHKQEPVRINVIALFSAFEENGQRRRILPLRFTLPDGSVHKIRQVRTSYSERVGGSMHVHFVVKTDADRYFDIVYDSAAMFWLLVIEVQSNWIPRRDEITYKGDSVR